MAERHFDQMTIDEKLMVGKSVSPILSIINMIDEVPPHVAVVISQKCTEYVRSELQ